MMRITTLTLIASAFLMLVACKQEDEVQITIYPEVINAGYIGNGAEWDPYDEAESWGATVSEEDWQTLFKRLDYMKMGYVRCMINSPYRYYDAAAGTYDKNRNIESISKLLKYCTERNINVIFGEYNPPSWDMKQDQKWVDMSVDYLNYLVNDLGFTCIKYFVIFNEPDGDWASPNGDYLLWKEMLTRFDKKMKEYPGLSDKVKLAGPDIVADYANPNSEYDSEKWISQSVMDVDSLIGIYDIHAYPGQNQVRQGEYPSILNKYKKHIPEGKKIILGEAGYKYWREPDSLLMAEYNRRLIGHPYTKGSDCNMLCYDYFYGLDMPLLCMEVMNAGYSGMAAWMLDDAMHSNGDSGKPEDIKIWGMWNILGKEVFNKPEEEQIRPWFYTWSLMCRYFQPGSDILKSKVDTADKDIYTVAARHNDKHVVALVNVGDKDKVVTISLPFEMKQADLYLYQENNMQKDSDGFPVPAISDLKIDHSYKATLKARSFVLITDMNHQ
ncbi:MAG: hypothetical protein PHY27_02555 [Parabacteroides sp.]|jgi:hypothetical protein|uniref:hypothetical protein n=1 Tax=Macellibacteroides sp. TaxID=2014584 RepID=UPI002A183319|nr:hypothetical protein [Parabacteroides sp.]